MCDACDITIDVDHASYLSSLDRDELTTLKHHVERLHEDAEQTVNTSIHEAKLPASVSFTTSKHFRQINKATADLEAGRISRDDFLTKVKADTFKSYEDAYAKGKGVKVSQLTVGDREYLRRATETELGYLDGFADDLEAGTVGKGRKQSRQARVRSYSDSIDGVAWHGVVEKHAPDASTSIAWILGTADHCPSCLLLASASPYDRLTLPTTPRAGSTECRSITSPWARVLTDRGAVSIIDVRIGDRVLTHMGRWKKVTATPVYFSESYHRQAWVKAPTGKTVGFTSDHKFLSDGGWLAIGEVAKRRLSMYTVSHEMLKVWNENSKRSKERCLQNMQTCLSDVRKEEGSQGGRVHFVRHASEGKIAVGGPIIQGQDSFGHCGRWEKTTQVLRRFVLEAFLHSKTGWARLCAVLGGGTFSFDVPIPMAVDAGARAYSRWDGDSSYQWGLFRRQTRELRVDGIQGAPCHALARWFQPEVEGWHPRMGLSDLRQEVQDVSKRRIGRPQVLFKEVCGQGTVQGSRCAEVQGVRCQVREKDFRAQKVKRQILFSKVLQQSPLLYDLTVEDDCSFVIEGLVVHNSRCKCRLEFRAGKKLSDDDAAEAGYKRDAPLSELMNPPPPAGTRKPTPHERKHIDNLRTKMNYQRRRIAREQENVKRATTPAARARAQGRLKEAVKLRKGYNAELIEFTEQNKIFEVPVFSVDDVITEKDLGRRSKRDLLRHGIDGKSLSMLDVKSATRMFDWYEERIGTTFADDVISAGIVPKLEAKKKKQPHKINFIAVPHALRGKSNSLGMSLLAENLEKTFLLLTRAAVAAKGTRVIVGPFDGAVLARVGVWVEGDAEEVDAVLAKMRKLKTGKGG